MNVPALGHARMPSVRALTTPLMAVVVAVGAAMVGIILTSLSMRFDDGAPIGMIALVLGPIFVALALAMPVIGVIGVFATFPLGSVDVSLAIISLQTVEVAVLGVAALVILRRLAEGQTILPWGTPMSWALVLIVWTIVALPSAIDEELAIKQIAALGAGLVFAGVVIAAAPTMEHVRKVLGALVTVAAAITAGALMSGTSFESELGGTTVQGRLQGAFDQPNQLGIFCAITALIAFGLALGSRSRRAQVASAVATAILIGGLMLSLSRGAWIGSIFALLFLILTLREARRLVIFIGVPLLVLALALGALAPTSPQIQVVGERVQAITTLSPYDNRPQIWAEARREIADDPWTGQGPGSFPVASIRAASRSSTVFAHHAHNLLLTWAAESGLPAALIIVLLALSIASTGRTATRNAAARNDPRDRAVIAGSGAALIAVAGQGLVDYTLRNAVIFFTFWGVVGALLAAARVTSPIPVPQVAAGDAPAPAETTR